MRQLFTGLLVLAIVLGALVLLGPALPQGPLRDFGEALRAVGRGIAGGFGGGYTQPLSG
jgi:hypothetical protein